MVNVGKYTSPMDPMGSGYLAANGMYFSMVMRIEMPYNLLLIVVWSGQPVEMVVYSTWMSFPKYDTSLIYLCESFHISPP